MNILAIDTATDTCSVALAVKNDLLVDHRLAPQQHAKLLLPMIDALFSQANLSPSMLDAVVFGRGPGSFTGLRIAAAAAQGIALAHDIGVVPVSTLHMLAQGVYRTAGHTHVMAVLDARMDEVYYGSFVADDIATDRTALMVPLDAERVCAPDTLALPDAAQSWCLAGSGAELLPVFRASTGSNQGVIVDKTHSPQAQDAIRLARVQIDQGLTQSAEYATPVYLRDQVALTESERQKANPKP